MCLCSRRYLVLMLGSTLFVSCGKQTASREPDAAMTLADKGLDGSAMPTAGPDTGPSDSAQNQSDACRGRASDAYTVRLVGDGFGDYDGKVLFAATEITLVSVLGAVCRAASKVEIRQGSFDLSLTNLADGNIYPWVGAFIDMNGDGLCQSGVDPTWATFPPWASLSLTLSPTGFSPQIDCERLASP